MFTYKIFESFLGKALIASERTSRVAVNALITVAASVAPFDYHEAGFEQFLEVLLYFVFGLSEPDFLHSNSIWAFRSLACCWRSGFVS